MAISKKLKITKGELTVVPAEPTIGLLLGVVHIGIHKNVYLGVTSHVDQVLLQFELQDVLTDKGTPVVFSKLERNSLHEKANIPKLGKAMGLDVEEGIDFEELIGKPVLLGLEHNKDKTRVNIKSYSPIPKMMKSAIKPLMGTPKLYLDVDELTEGQVAELPEWIRKKLTERVTSGAVEKSTEARESGNSAVDL